MDAIQTLFEHDSPPRDSLPDALARLYDGGLLIPAAGPGGRPYVIANFVETLDGVISFTGPGQAGGGDVSGFNEADHFVMGVLRAYADAVIFGTGTLHEDSGHVRVAEFIYPPLTAEYAALRRQLGRATPHPLNVVVSASGRVNLDEPTFHYPNLRAVIATTSQGAERLSSATLPEGVDVRAIGTANDDVDPVVLLDLLAREYGVRLALHEGGPRLLASFAAAGALDELFLTLAPQLAGRSAQVPRPALVEGHAFAPGTEWSTLLSLKRAGSHLMLRYALRHEQDGQ